MFSRIFLDHPHSIGESYFEHQQNALEFAGWMLLGSAACLIHALIPAVCRSTGSRTVGRLYRRMIVNRSKQADAQMPLEQASVDVWEHWEI
jgi:hypothetical protein